MPNKLYLSLLAGVMLLSGCATLSEEQCRRGDWFHIGFTDGQAGQVKRAMTKHAEACGDYGIVPDAEDYQRGYSSGLEYFCTLAGGLKSGRRGQTYQGVCPGQTLAKFQQGHRLGYEIYLLRREIEELESYLYHLQFDHVADCNTTQRNGYPCRARNYYSRYSYERTHLHSLELRLLNLERQAADLLLNQMAYPDAHNY